VLFCKIKIKKKRKKDLCHPPQKKKWAERKVQRVQSARAAAPRARWRMLPICRLER